MRACLMPEHPRSVASPGTLRPRPAARTSSPAPASQLRQAEEPLRATGAGADGLVGVCCLQRHRRRQAGGSPRTLHGHPRDAKRVPRRPGLGGACPALANRTCSRSSGRRVGQPGRTPPGGAGSEAAGEGKATEAAFYLREPLTPLSACFLICKGGILPAPEGRCEGQIGEDGPCQCPLGPALSGAGGSAVLTGPGSSRERPLRAQTGRDGPCHQTLPGRWGDGQAGAPADGGGDR